ncbi:helicase ARIP4 [Caerostris extrusa]|uniref:Helicase ARIP4 n=1 Tax=Caerostris extrusa TaxID=172846 RepID=A0AAV4XEK7_CAEEX|nr:helicase ARIP4 [Caerostris extrusa]
MDEMYEHIVIPGPDLVICDEGHRIKNSLASTSMALKSIKTRRRVVLTEQNFCNMFERPISNGQCIDSTPRDRQLMRFRSHVLHSLLVGFVQRRGHSVLRAVLPKKRTCVAYKNDTNSKTIVQMLCQRPPAQEDIDLDIDINIASGSAISGSNTKKRAIGQKQIQIDSEVSKRQFQ